eukprot:TRINITY_DN46361_c0_g1_i2.p2 TRINITY_DN46361_c0_g1~~TRINITY_DN46361_c0_g1_i2.p2  ORF type:complete len:284 (-),score=70.86 TRINITY_DN46361_c0_g1_i2:422-1273(-)
MLRSLVGSEMCIRDRKKPPPMQPIPGVYPTMVTPFLPDSLAIDWERLDALTEWYIAAGCTGLFTVCISSEMYNLTNEEKLKMAERVHTRAAGRVAVVASGTFGGPIEDQAVFVNEISQFCDAVVVIVCQMCCEGDNEEVWMANTQRLLDLTPGVPLGLYECPVPHWRLLSANALGWCARTGRFHFHKDTCCATQAIADKLKAVSGVENFKFFNANVETLLFSLKQGSHGFSGISANFYPWLHVFLCNEPCDSPRAEKVQRFLSVFENVVTMVYPRCRAGLDGC